MAGKRLCERGIDRVRRKRTLGLAFFSGASGGPFSGPVGTSTAEDTRRWGVPWLYLPLFLNQNASISARHDARAKTRLFLVQLPAADQAENSQARVEHRV